MANLALEKHYRVKELANLWGISPKTVVRIFGEEVDVIRVADNGTGRRRYTTLSIPESVALRVHERLGARTRPEITTKERTVRVIRLYENATTLVGGRGSKEQRDQEQPDRITQALPSDSATMRSSRRFRAPTHLA